MSLHTPFPNNHPPKPTSSNEDEEKSHSDDAEKTVSDKENDSTRDDDEANKKKKKHSEPLQQYIYVVGMGVSSYLGGSTYLKDSGGHITSLLVHLVELTVCTILVVKE